MHHRCCPCSLDSLCAPIAPNTHDKDKNLDIGHMKRYDMLSLSLLRISTIAPGGIHGLLSTDNSLVAMPLESGTPTGTVVVPSRYQSDTIIARPVWDPTQATNGNLGTPVHASLTTIHSHRGHRTSP